MQFTHGEIQKTKYFFEGGRFLAPPVGLWPCYGWFWNGAATEEGIRERLDIYYEKNIKILYILPVPKNFRPETSPTYMDPDYLTEDWFKIYRFAVEYAAEKGMELWLYDEGGWPSGGACGKVVEAKPQLGYKVIIKKQVSSPYMPTDGALAAFADGKRIKAGTVTDSPITEYSLYVDTERSRTHPAIPNLLEEEVTETFISLTHEGYKRHLGEHLGKTVKAVFTDEPGVGRVPWSPELPGIFQKRYGYDLLDVLEYITAPQENDVDKVGRKARMDFWDLVAELFAKNYFLKIRTWCRENGMYATGHLGGEDETLGCVKHSYHHCLRQLRCMDIPGIDVIWRQIFPGNENNHFFPRFASSAANQIGANYTVTESFGVYGGGLTFDQMRYVILYQMVRGINLINIISAYYGNTERFLMVERPEFDAAMPTWEHLGEFNEYVARLSYLMSLGKWGADCALYMPMRVFWGGGTAMTEAGKEVDALAKALERQHCVFDLIDDDFLETAVCKDGMLCTGTAEYKTVVMPKCNELSVKATEKLNLFRAQGGVVLSDADIADAPKAAEISSQDVAVGRRILPDGSLYLLYNEGTKPVDFTVRFKEKGNIYEADARDGKLYAAKTEDITLASGEERIFLITEKHFSAEERMVCTDDVCVISDFEVRREKIFTIGRERYEWEQVSESFRPCGPESLESLFSKEFSGVVTYRIRFKADCWKKATIDLGRVENGCDVQLNGTALGTRLFAPYVFEVDGSLLEKDNELIVRVSTTPGNQYAHTKVLDDWEECYKGPYHTKQKMFEKEAGPSGILTPITIRYSI
ncbi:MAG: hypothetical protein IJN25_01015 [Clostridia bacterium]|nr:hypothetical protein [Clostridia bacterium]